MQTYFFIEISIVFLVGICVGSFLNVLITRIPKKESILGRSYCDHTGEKLRWFELVPIISFLIQGGKSRHSGKPLSICYPIVECITGVVFVLFWVRLTTQAAKYKTNMVTTMFGVELDMVLFFAFISLCLTILFIDMKHFIIPNRLQIAFFIVSVIIKLLSGQFFSTFFIDIFSAFLVALPFMLILFATKGKGIGVGDIKLAANIGYLFQWQIGFIVIYLSFVIGAVVSVALLIFGIVSRKSKLPFAPFLIMSIFVVMFFYAQIRMYVFS